MRQAVSEDSFEARAPRLDPYALPVSYALPSRAGRSAAQRGRVTLSRDRAVVSGAGRGEEFALPLKAYRGVAVRIEPLEGDRVRVVVELNHADPRLSLPLLVADDPADVVADWQAWSRSLGLPMLLFEADGTLSEPVPHMGQVVLHAAQPRRRHAFATRRPRFLVRRKMGFGGGEMVDGEEIIAPE